MVETCTTLIPMFGIKNIYMWGGNTWVHRDSLKLILEVESGEIQIKKIHVINHSQSRQM